MSYQRRVRIHSGKRDLARFPQEDEALVQRLAQYGRDALEKGLPRPAILVLKSEQVMQYDLPALLAPERSLTSPILAAISGQDGVECMALVGTLRMRSGRRSEPMQVITVFVEWPDNRWSMSWQGLDSKRNLVGDGPILRSAIDGWPRPTGLGGWFSRARREGLRLRVARSEPDVQVH